MSSSQEESSKESRKSNVAKLSDLFSAKLKNYQLEVIDLREKPEMAGEHSIMAIPTLVRLLPLPVRRIIGDLSDTERLSVSLDL